MSYLQERDCARADGLQMLKEVNIQKNQALLRLAVSETGHQKRSLMCPRELE